MVTKNGWVVRLGKAEWAHHTYERAANDDLRLLGSVRRGAQIGALGITAAGTYVQVVGDHLVALNKSQIARAIGALERPASAVRVPVVVIKRRRIPLTTE